MELDNYIQYIKNKITDMDLSETELIMYIYIDLGYRLRYDNDFYLSTHKRQKYLYNHSSNNNDINNCFKTGKINCKSVAYILKYVLEKFGVNISVEECQDDFREFKHVYNIITPKRGEKYTIDLQDDMINIYFQGKTKAFGRSLEDKKYVIDLTEQKQIHSKIKYITPNNTYTDEYIDVLKIYGDTYDKFYEKLDFVLSNINPIRDINANYWEIRWRHDHILKKLFRFEDLFSKLHTIEFYKKDADGHREFTNGFYIHNKDGVFVYYYENNTYQKYNIKDFAIKVINEEIYYRQNVQGLNSRVKSYKKIIK